MGVMELDAWFYEVRFQDEVARQLDKGLDLIAARAMAREILGRAFISRAAILQDEFQKDHDEYIRDMSIGGRRFKERGR